MIRLYNQTGNEENTVVLTLDEKRTLPAADIQYVFKFTNDFTGESVVFYTPDISTWPSRYNKFVITLVNDPGDTDLYNGTLYLEPTGYWTYVVYEMELTSPTNLDPADAVAVMETGKVLVQADTCVLPAFNPADEVVPAFNPDNCD